MHPIPERPFVSSDTQIAIEIERWLDRTGYQIAYGAQSARAERGDFLLQSPLGPSAPHPFPS